MEAREGDVADREQILATSGDEIHDIGGDVLARVQAVALAERVASEVELREEQTTWSDEKVRYLDRIHEQLLPGRRPEHACSQSTALR